MDKFTNSGENINWKIRWKKIKGQIQALLWPEVCPFCEKVYRQGICPKCKEKLRKIEIRGYLCMKCGKPLAYKEQEYCFDCKRKNHSYDRGYSVWLHKEPASKAIYRFKYGNQRRYGYFFGQEMGRIFAKYLREKKIDVIIPIPLHRKRRRKRGLWFTFFWVTLGYVMVVGIGVYMAMDALTKIMSGAFLLFFAGGILIGYICVLGIYMVATSYIYGEKHKEARKRVRIYNHNLVRLLKLYDKENKKNG